MRLLFLLLPFVLIFSCNNQQKQIDQLKDEVIAIHDEVMPKTADINRVKRKLKAIAKDTTLTETQKGQLLNQITELTKANEAMSQWMAEFKQPAADDKFENTMKMLNDEKGKITAVKDLMLSSLENGQELLKQMQEAQ